jgi:hypothetical protein
VNTTRAVLVALLALMLGAPVAAKERSEPRCIKGKVPTAFQTLMLQESFEWGALSCGMSSRYADFRSAYKSELAEADETLLKHFGDRETLAAFRSMTYAKSAQRNRSNPAACDRISAVYDQILAPKKVEFVLFLQSEPLAQGYDQNVCGEPTTVIAAKSTLRPEDRKGVAVNADLWRASLDTLSFMPMDQIDPYGGVIKSGWWVPPSTPNERIRVFVVILDTRLRAEALRVTVFKEMKTPSGKWQTAAAMDPAAVTKLENIILNKAGIRSPETSTTSSSWSQLQVTDPDGLTCINLGFSAGTPEIADCRLRLMEFRQREADRSAAIAEQERQNSLRRLQLAFCLMNGTCDPTRRPASRSDDDDLHPVFITLPNGRRVTCHRAGPSINCM